MHSIISACNSGSLCLSSLCLSLSVCLSVCLSLSLSLATTSGVARSLSLHLDQPPHTAPRPHRLARVAGRTRVSRPRLWPGSCPCRSGLASPYRTGLFDRTVESSPSLPGELDDRIIHNIFSAFDRQDFYAHPPDQAGDRHRSLPRYRPSASHGNAEQPVQSFEIETAVASFLRAPTHILVVGPPTSGLKQAHSRPVSASATKLITEASLADQAPDLSAGAAATADYCPRLRAA